jgi:putative transposase
VKMDPFIEAEEVAGHSVNHCCAVFKVSRAAYYERKKDVPSARAVTDAELTEQITAVHQESKGTYGSPRVHAELRRQGVSCGRRRVRRLMRLSGLEGRCKKRWRKTTIPDPGAALARDLIQRHFGPCQELDRRYVGDITYVMTWEGWAYLATVIDLASRRVVGWSIADHMRTELVEDALTMAFAQRRPPEGLIFHSDRGTQGEINRSSQHLDHGGVRWDRTAGSCCGRRRVPGDSGRRIGRCEHRCVPRGVLSLRAPCSESSGA